MNWEKKAGKAIITFNILQAKQLNSLSMQAAVQAEVKVIKEAQILWIPVSLSLVRQDSRRAKKKPGRLWQTEYNMYKTE